MYYEDEEIEEETKMSEAMRVFLEFQDHNYPLGSDDEWNDIICRHHICDLEHGFDEPNPNNYYLHFHDGSILHCDMDKGWNIVLSFYGDEDDLEGEVA